MPGGDCPRFGILNAVGIMTEPSESMERLADQVRLALDTGDLAAYADLLDPKARWGAPGHPSPPCQSREQVLSWYKKSRDAGMTARVSSVEVVGDSLLVGLVVRGSPAAQERGGNALRWQVLAVRDGTVFTIVGFETRSEALAHAEGST